MERYQDENDPLNGPDFLSGFMCMEECGRPAGTYWSPFWCQACNAKRLGAMRTNGLDSGGAPIEEQKRDGRLV